MLLLFVVPRQRDAVGHIAIDDRDGVIVVQIKPFGGAPCCGGPERLVARESSLENSNSRVDYPILGRRLGRRLGRGRRLLEEGRLLGFRTSRKSTVFSL